MSTATGTTLRAWDAHLARAVDALPERPDSGQLRAVAAALAAAAARYDLPIRPAPSGDRILLAGGAGADGAVGPYLAIGDFPAGESTTVHDHGVWGAGVVLAGTDRWERFDAATHLVQARELDAGDTFVIGAPPDDVHRQTPLGGPVRELLLFGVDPHTFPRTDRQPADSPVERAVAALLHGDRTAMSALYAPDALLDVNVPQWWFQVTGQAGIDTLLRQELDVPGRRCTALRRTDTSDGVLVETAVRFPAPGGDNYWRDQHHLVFDNGLIVEHVVYCTGIWDAATVARHAADVELVRP